MNRKLNFQFLHFSLALSLNITENQERLYLLLIISVTSGVVLCLLIVIARWIFIRRKPSKDESSEQGKAPAQFKTSNTGETTITNGFSADDISEIDADIDLTTPLPMSTGSSSITRNDVSQYESCFIFSHFLSTICTHTQKNIHGVCVCLNM